MKSESLEVVCCPGDKFQKWGHSSFAAILPEVLVEWPPCPVLTIKPSLPLIPCVFMWSLLSIDLETEIASDNIFHCCQHLFILVKVFFFLCVNMFFIGTMLFWPTENYLYLNVSCLKILSLIGLRYCSKGSLCVYLHLQQICSIGGILHLVTEESKAERG